MPINATSGNVRHYLFESYGYFEGVFKNECLRLEKFGDRRCYYECVLSLDKEHIEKLPDSLINFLQDIIVRDFRLFPNNKGKTFLNDGQCVRFLVETFCDSSISKEVRNNAFESLAQKASFNVLLPYKEKLISVIEDSVLKKQFSFKSRTRVAALLNCDQKEMARLFVDDPELPLNVQARSGNKKAVTDLIKTFEKETKFEKKIRAIRGLIFSGDSAAIRYVLKNFNKPIADTIEGCVDNTLQNEIITNLKGYYPDSTLFEKEFNKAMCYSMLTINEDSVKAYFEKVYLWMDRNYGVKPIDPQPFKFIKQKCVRKIIEGITN